MALVSLLLLGSISCEIGTPQDRGGEVFEPNERRISIPGHRYDKVIMYEHDILLASPRSFSLREELDEYTWDLFSQEHRQPGIRLFPAHHADLNVALWHQTQVPDSAMVSFIPQITFVYYDHNHEVSGVLIDHNNKMAWARSNKIISLSSTAVNRIMVICKELKDPLNSR